MADEAHCNLTSGLAENRLILRKFRGLSRPQFLLPLI